MPQKDVFLGESLLSNLTGHLKKICPEASVFSVKMENNILKYSNEDLSVEYAKLFVGPYELKAPPYGSVYLDNAKIVMGDSTMKVIKLYEEEGLRRDSNFRELPDHISVELEFMYFLIYSEVEALKKADITAAKRYTERQGAFMNEILSKWIPLCCEKIKKGTENDFYTALADCTSVYLKNSLKS
ncbi:MAG: molecular chaperone TorD family protein [Nitrospirae bacterium]|nr:molecular chaperone TorD family protein [Nitrospirota bacterium]